MNNENETAREDVVFLFGAGASVDADVPDTYKFVEDFKHYIKKRDSKLHEQLVKILEIKERFNERTLDVGKRQVDIEQLLHTISRLIDRDNEVLLDFYEEKTFDKDIVEDTQVLQNLKRILEDFIREKVIVKEEKKLEYLEELLKFPLPLEIFSVNYDTCIEQLSHMSHMRYTDGFDTYWDRSNFSNKDFHVKHYKMHGSVIWYENKKTKECVKIPVHAFVEGKPARLKLIYGEDVEPLLIYPAQKMEYIEPLTELQLMFKERLVKKETKILVVVGYSFRDEYIIHMLWDAGRENDDLHIVLISPTAQEHFEKKLRFIDKNRKDSSRICNRVVCLPYPYSTVIYRLKNHYLQKLNNIRRIEKQFIETQKYDVEPKWQDLLELCIECEFLTKAESILEEKIKWSELRFSLPQSLTLLGVKAMLHSVIARDGHEEDWVKRVNESMKFLNIENLEVQYLSANGFQLLLKVEPNETRSFKDIVEKWVASIIKERNDKLKLLSTRYESQLATIEESFKRLEKFQDYLSKLKDVVKWEKYFEARKKSGKIDELKKLYEAEQSPEDRFSKSTQRKIASDIVLTIEKEVLKKIFGGNVFQFRL